MLVLRDEQVGDFLEGEPALEYRRRLASARQSSQADYEKEIELVKLHKQNRVDQAKRNEESRRLK
jgi:hypothetical protein